MRRYYLEDADDAPKAAKKPKTAGAGAGAGGGGGGGGGGSPESSDDDDDDDDSLTDVGSSSEDEEAGAGAGAGAKRPRETREPAVGHESIFQSAYYALRGNIPADTKAKKAGVLNNLQLLHESIDAILAHAEKHNIAAMRAKYVDYKVRLDAAGTDTDALFALGFK